MTHQQKNDNKREVNPLFFFFNLLSGSIYYKVIMSNTINIKFPFKDSVKGFFLGMNEDDASAIKSDLMHLLLTAKGERYYLPDFGTNLKKYIFEPNDGITHAEIRQELNDTIKKFIPNLLITAIDIRQKENSEYVASVRLDYVVSEGVFETSDFVIIEM